MTTALQMLPAVKALVQAAVPSASVIGFDEGASIPEVIPAEGMVVGLPSDPGEAQIDLGTNDHNYEHSIPLEVSAPFGSALTLDDMLIAIGAGVRADRYLGGRCSWLEATAPIREERTVEEATINWAEFSIVAHYSTPDPLA